MGYKIFVVQLIRTHGWLVTFCGQFEFNLTECQDKALEGLQANFGRIELAFPKDDDVPAEELQRLAIFEVAGFVTLNLSLPEVGAGTRHHEVFATHSSPFVLDRRWQWRLGVSMPETAVHEDDSAETAYHDVGRSRQSLHVQTIPEAMGIEVLPHPKLGLGVLRTDVAHALMTLFWRKLVCHGSVFLEKMKNGGH